MSWIEATCPKCGTVERTASDFELVICDRPEASYYSFVCPVCNDRVQKHAEERVIELLVAEGVTVPDGEGVVPPPGYVLIRNREGRGYWVPPDKPVTLPTDFVATLEKRAPTGVLTEQQIERVKEFRRTIEAVDPRPLEDVLADLRREENPEREIVLWEWMAAIFEWETSDRAPIGDEERGLVWRAVLAASFDPNIDAVRKMVPELTNLRDLERVISRFLSYLR